jgi:hypothetical protein
MRAVIWVAGNLCMALLAVMMGLVPPASAFDLLAARESLQGLSEVWVLVDAIDADVEREGLTKSALQTDVEQRLRHAGIRVLTNPELLVAILSPHVHVRVLTRRHAAGDYAVVVDLELTQIVTLVRNPTVLVGARTWKAPARIAVLGATNLPQVRERVRELVDQFAAAYVAANPTK